ncbi:MAG: YqaA family protein [Candidatus Puniceispirillales bacterium WSBS_2018_MAG_OTU23]
MTPIKPAANKSDTRKLSLYEKTLAKLPFLARLQDWVITLGQRKSAVKWLMGLTFLESIIFPIPTDPLLAGLVIARPQHYLRLALLAAVFSTLGGIVGWGIGILLGDAAISSGWMGEDSAYQTVKAGFEAHGWLIVFIGAFTPLPYKIVVVSAGFLGIGFWPLVIASLVGRSVRFMMVASIARHRNDNLKAAILIVLLAVLMVVFLEIVN